MNQPMESPGAAYNPWTIVNLVFKHLAEQGLQPLLGETDPVQPASSLLSALGISPAVGSGPQVLQRRDAELAALRSIFFPDGAV